MGQPDERRHSSSVRTDVAFRAVSAHISFADNPIHDIEYCDLAHHVSRIMTAQVLDVAHCLFPTGIWPLALRR